METLIKASSMAEHLLANYFVVEFIKGLEIEKERITSFTYNKDKDEFEFTMPILVGENPDNIIKELYENNEFIDFKICYTDKQGNIVFEKEANGYMITSSFWTLMGHYHMSSPISVKFTLKGYETRRTDREWVL
jgi:hypothetical protein